MVTRYQKGSWPLSFYHLFPFSGLKLYNFSSSGIHMDVLVNDKPNIKRSVLSFTIEEAIRQN
jgi:hypothetical protein